MQKPSLFFLSAFFLLAVTPFLLKAATESECKALRALGKSCDSSTMVTAADQALLQLNSAPHAYLLTKLTGQGKEHVTGLNTEFASRLAKFIKAGEVAGYNITIFSGYRSPERQAVLFKEAVAKYGSVSAARKWVAPPGASNHNKGIAADLKFDGSSGSKTKGCLNKACFWAHENAASFGLSFRLGHEPWHIEPKGNVPGGAGSGSGTKAPGSDLVRNLLSGLTGGSSGQNTSNQNSQKCQQMAEQCKAGNSGACTAYPYECQGQQQPPSGGAQSGPSGSAPSAGSNPGTSGVTSAYQPPAIATAPTTVVSTTVATSTTTATSTDIIQDTLTTLTVSNQATTTPKNPLDPTTVIRLAQERTTLQPEAPVTGLPPTIVNAPQQFTTPGGSTFGEGKFTNTPNESLETHALPTGGTFASGTFGATLSQIKTVLEGILTYLQPFSAARYAPPAEDGHFHEDETEIESIYTGDEWTNEDAAALFGDEGAAALFDDGFEFPRFNQ